MVLLGLGTPSSACTLFKVTQGGRTMVGNNEDAWSINARIRFENGRPGEFGAVYLDHYNGSPLRRMIDQGWIEGTGQREAAGAFRPAELYTFRMEKGE